ncbi:MAG TPA: hypothetical protein VMT85_20405 [Thermoanaerobaculia bacterium]|nr:hypothetical protein [Thermoanaerobaculia bacterium]
MRGATLLAAALVLLPAAAERGGAGQSGAGDGATRIELRVEPAVALWTEGRALAESRTEASGPLAPLIDAMRALGAKLPPGRGWGLFDSALLGVTGAQEIADRLSGISTLRLHDGAQVEVGVGVGVEVERLLAALVELEPRFREELWPARRELVDAARVDIESRLLPKQDEAFAAMLSALEMTDPRRTIPVYLVPSSVWPGAVTYRDRDGTGYCIVAVDRRENQGSALLEIILHEATHALDVAAEQSAGRNVLSRLRGRLGAAGLGPADDAFRDLPHTIMFVQAGETIRRLVDPDHVHYGDGPSTYYDRVPRARLVRDLWIAHLDGEVTLDQVLDRLVESAMEPPP